MRVRSDLERKRLHGLAERDASGSGLGEDLYSATATRRTYDALARAAATALDAGLTTIVDATFLHRDERERFARIAADKRAPFVILDCTAPVAELRRRIGQRASVGRDASEATTAVLDSQLASGDPLAPEETAACLEIDTTATLDYEEVVSRVRALGSR